MADFLLIPFVALFASFLTFFSGFGLGTVLLPLFSVFFSLPLAIALAAWVHLFNNLFKLLLVIKKVNTKVTMIFGLSALGASLAGALCLKYLSELPPFLTYTFLEKSYSISPLKTIVGFLLLFFVIVDFKNIYSFPASKKFLLLGGLLSGFFGGLSGFQGAFRSLFLLKQHLSKESFIATGIAVACLIDIARIPAYTFSFQEIPNLYLVFVTTLASFLGAYLGAHFLKKVTLQHIKILIAIFVSAIATGLIFGVI